MVSPTAARAPEHRLLLTVMDVPSDFQAEEIEAAEASKVAVEGNQAQSARLGESCQVGIGPMARCCVCTQGPLFHPGFATFRFGGQNDLGQSARR